MSSLIRESAQPENSYDRRLWIVAGFAAIVLAAFLLAPGTVASKTHVALHGLCAQRPSHSIQIGGATLPMDARMTGIYIGAAISVCWLIAAGRMRAMRPPSLSVIVTLAVLVAALAVDGFNALLVDLAMLHPYEPSNALRLVTGVLAGTALGVVLGHLCAVSMWSQGDRRIAVVTTPRELIVPLLISGGVGWLAMTDLPVLFAPFAVGLLAAAVGVFSLLGMVFVALVSDRGWSSRTIGDLAPMACAGFGAAIVMIGALSGLRFLAEHVFGLPRLT